jgi:beta-lactamase superfamily II metal-dependent hydrolase
VEHEVSVVALSQYYSASQDISDGYGTCIVIHDYPTPKDTTSDPLKSTTTKTVEDELEDILKSNSSFCLVFDLGSDKGKTLHKYLDDHKITAIDALYISHFHTDHYQPEAI